MLNASSMRPLERTERRLNASDVDSRISALATELVELRALRRDIAAGIHAGPAYVWLMSTLDNRERELKERARSLADSLKPLPKPDAKRQRKA